MANDERQEIDKGLRATILQSTVCIVKVSEDRTDADNGSGTLIRWRGRHLILTAAHVIENAQPEDLRFLFPPANTRPTLSFEEMQTLSGLPAEKVVWWEELELGRIVCDPHPGLDLAAIEVSSDLDKQGSVCFADLVEGGQTPPEGQKIIITGYPSKNHRWLEDEGPLYFPQVTRTQIQPNRPMKDFDPDQHFLASYNLQKLTPPGPEPHGISGAAAWVPVEKDSIIWHPDKDMAGVATNWYRREGLMKVVRREAVEGFLIAKVSW
jgi:hypothetical protein